MAPLTNLQSEVDGRLSKEEAHWLSLRAMGGFGMVTTCAANVLREGQGFPRQLGVYSDVQVPRLARLARALQVNGALATVQLYHAGLRAPQRLVGHPVSASGDEATGARALTTGEVEGVVEAFAAAAVRVESAGFDGVQIHGAHGYLLQQFLSPQVNRRTDRYGGSLENRARIYFEIVDAIRARCGSEFQVGLRYSPQRLGVMISDEIELIGALFRQGRIDYLDLSLSDTDKTVVTADGVTRSILSLFSRLPRGLVRLGAAGMIYSLPRIENLMANGVDFVSLGRAAILHHDFPQRAAVSDFEMRGLPVSADYLRAEGLGPRFVEYIRTWPGFVSAD